MKKNILILALIVASITNSFSQKGGYEIKVKIDGLKDTVCYLAGYYGPKQYYKDTAKVNKNGLAVFKGDTELPGGIYSVVLPDNATYFEFLLIDQFFSLETKLGNQQVMSENLQVTGSDETSLFVDYLKFVGKKQVSATPYRKQYSDSTASKSQKEKAKTKLQEIEKEVTDYKLNLMETHPNSFVTKLFKASQEPEIPESKDWPTLENGKKDSLFPRRFYLANYWANVDLKDDRLLRSPVFHGRLQKYIDNVILQHPDTIIKSADALIAKTNGDDEMFKYIVHYVTNKYERSEIMCMDRVFVHMGEKYYESGKAFWMDSTKLAKVVERVVKMRPTVCGAKTPNVILQDTSESKWVSLYDINAKYTILYFWDSGCSHCKKETPKLKTLYDKYKNNGVEVFAVGTEFEGDAWRKYIRENDLNFINVSDNPEINKNAYQYLKYTTIESLNFRDTYDIYSTPRVFLLDENKEIIAKRIGIDQLDNLLADKLGLPKTEVKEENTKSKKKKK